MRWSENSALRTIIPRVTPAAQKGLRRREREGEDFAAAPNGNTETLPEAPCDELVVTQERAGV